MNFLDAFAAIYIINLRRRSDRRAEMISQLERMGLGDDPRIDFFQAAEPDNLGPFSLRGAHGCYLSHLQIYEKEAGRNRTVLVLEDDCDFLSAARSYTLPEQWDIFYGGYTAENPSDLHTSNIIGSHCMGYSARAMQLVAEYLKALLDPEFPPDERAALDPGFDPAVRPPLDGALVWFRRAHPELTTVFAEISEQRPSRSDISPQSWLDRAAPTMASIVRKARRRLR